MAMECIRHQYLGKLFISSTLTFFRFIYTNITIANLFSTGGVTALWPGASMICMVFPYEVLWSPNNQRPIVLLCLELV